MRVLLQCAAGRFGFTPLALHLTRYALRRWVFRHLCPCADPLAFFEQVINRQLPCADVVQSWLHDDDLDGLDLVQMLVLCISTECVQYRLRVILRLYPVPLSIFQINDGHLGVIQDNRIRRSKSIRDPVAKVHALFKHLLAIQLPHDIDVYLYCLCHFLRDDVVRVFR